MKSLCIEDTSPSDCDKSWPFQKFNLEPSFVWSFKVQMPDVSSSSQSPMREGWEDWCVVSSGRAKYKKYRQMDNRALQCSTIKCTGNCLHYPRWKEQTRVEKWDPTTFPFPGKSIQGKLSTELNHSGAESSSSSQRIIIDIGYRDKEFGWSGIVERWWAAEWSWIFATLTDW